MRLTGKEIGGKVQILLSDPGFGARFKGFQHQVFLDNRPSLLEGCIYSDFQSRPSPLVWWGGAVKGLQVLLISGISKV